MKTPISTDEIKKLKAGDIISISGKIITARDSAHERIIKFIESNRNLPFNLNGIPLFHCGPLVKKCRSKWKVIAAGPTTSMRMETYEYEIIRSLGVRLIIGKGGMGERTKKAIQKYGAVYTVLTGGVAVLAAKKIKSVICVEWLDLGITDAVWTLEVENFGPLVVAIDSQGNSLFEKKIHNKRNANIF